MEACASWVRAERGPSSGAALQLFMNPPKEEKKGCLTAYLGTWVVLYLFSGGMASRECFTIDPTAATRSAYGSQLLRVGPQDRSHHAWDPGTGHGTVVQHDPGVVLRAVRRLA